MQRLEWTVSGVSGKSSASQVATGCETDIKLGGERQTHAVAIEMSDPGH
jgi:hypothetical protein